MGSNFIATNTNRAIFNLEALSLAQQNSGCSPLFSKLPGEIRNNIYGMVLIEQGRIPPNKEPALLSVSSQIRKEATTFFYPQNVFHIAIDVTNVKESKSVKWLRAIGKAKTGALGKVRVCLSDAKVEEVLATMKDDVSFNNLAALEKLAEPGHQAAATAAEILHSHGVDIMKLELCPRCTPGIDADGNFPPQQSNKARIQVWHSQLIMMRFLGGRKKQLAVTLEILAMVAKAKSPRGLEVPPSGAPVEEWVVFAADFVKKIETNQG